MPWLRLESDFVSHPKLVELAGHITNHDPNPPRDAVLGDAIEIVLRLWEFTARHAPYDGDITRWINHVEHYLRTSDGLSVSVDDVILSGFIDHVGDDYIVHDWEATNGRHLRALAEKKRKDRDRLAAKRGRSRSEVAATSPRNENGNENGVGDSGESPKRARMTYPYQTAADLWNEIVVPVRCMYLGRAPTDGDFLAADHFKHDRFRKWWREHDDENALHYLIGEIARGSQWFLLELYELLVQGWAFGPNNYVKTMSGKYRDDTGRAKRVLHRLEEAASTPEKTAEFLEETNPKPARRAGGMRKAGDILPDVVNA